MIYSRPCTGCGSPTTTKQAGGTFFCQECKEQRKCDARDRLRSHFHVEYEYKIVYDPIPIEDGGFKKGSTMTKKQLKCMLQPEFRALAVGTILEDLRGKKFTIDQRPYGNGLTLEECDG